MSQIEDHYLDNDHYNYIEIGKELWYENPNAKAKNGEIYPKVSPFNKSFVTSKDNLKKIVKFKDESICEFSKTLPILNPIALNACDMAEIKDINEVDLLINLKNRYLMSNSNINSNSLSNTLSSKPQIFTNVGPTLLIVNPFKTLEGVYGSQMIDYFLTCHQNSSPEQRKELTESHLYDTVLISIRELLKPNSLNQVLIVSGESGAGKTETAKDAMKCITCYFSTKFSRKGIGNSNSDTISNNTSKRNSAQNLIEYKPKDNLEDQILNCNPILEAFGNAKTIRNDNSSRFGKYVKIKFNPSSYAIEGAKIKTYLLEKSRISELSIAERNYHIFYMLLKGAKDNELKQYHLTRSINSYSFLYKGPQQIISLDKISDSASYKGLINCFQSTGFTNDDVIMIFKVLAVVLHLGNLKIIKKNDYEVEIITIEDFDYVTELLEVDHMLLLNNLTRKPPSKHMLEWGSIYEDKTIKQYIDSLAKDLYNKLFQWIVEKLNEKLNKKPLPYASTSASQLKQRYIGLLDIFGFECLQKNSLEQFCINYTNEKLQQLYIKDIFESDKDEFKREGLEDKIQLLNATFKDNKDIIKCMDAFFYLTKSDVTDERVFNTASNFSKEIDKEDNKDKLDKLRDINTNCIFTDRINKEQFKLSHSAKDVVYTTKGWAEKNIDEIKDSMFDCILTSNNKVIQMIWTTTTNANDHNKKKQLILAEREESNMTKELRKYLGLKFQMDMDALKKSLEKCSHHYIRCIKPNEDKAPLVFWDNFVYNQIQYLGILGTIQVRKSGFPVRRKYKDFYEAFQLVHRRKKNIITIEDYMETTLQIITELMGRSYDYNNKCLFGRTKVYMKQIFNIALEKAKDERLRRKYKALTIIKVGCIEMRKRSQLKCIDHSITLVQRMYKTKEKVIKMNYKIDAIELIQSALIAKQEMEYYKASIKHIMTIQNGMRIVKAKKMVMHRNYLNNLLTVRLLLYSTKLQAKNKKKVVNATNNIMSILKQKIIDLECKAIWNRLGPFMIALVTRRKYKSIAIRAKLTSRVFMKEYMISIFRYRLLIKRIEERKAKSKVILNFGSTSMISNYYYNMIQKSTIIQRYLMRYINRRDAMKKVLNALIKEEESEMIQVYNESHQILFHNKGQCSGEHKRMCLLSFNDDIAESLPNTTYRHKRSPYKNEVVTYTESLNRRYNNSNNNFKAKTNRKYKLEEKKDVLTYTPSIGLFNENKINIFAHIAAIDIISSEKHSYEKLWAKEYERVFRMNIENNTPIQLIYAGNSHTFVLNSKGKAFSWGWNDKGQCGIDHQSLNRNFITPDINTVYGCELGSNYITPISLPISKLPINSYANIGSHIKLGFEDIGNISKVVIGDDYTMLLTEDKNVLFFGDNSRGQIGDSTNLFSKTIQFLPNEILKKGISDIYTTESFNGVLTKSNELFIWFLSPAAYNSSQLRLKQIFIEKKVIISQISCGKSFMIILSKSGLVYGCGSNTSSELALPADNGIKYHSLSEIVPLSMYQDRIIQIRCGFKHVVCVSSSCNAYTWGNNTYGQLGNGTKAITHSIIKIVIKGNKGIEERERIMQIAAGFRASMFMTDKRELYYCGILDSCNCSLSPIQFSYKAKLEEFSNQSEYTPVRILTSWNRSFSLFYLSIADIRQVVSNLKSISKVNPIINSLIEKWLDEGINPPYNQHYAQYFSFIKKTTK